MIFFRICWRLAKQVVQRRTSKVFRYHPFHNSLIVLLLKKYFAWFIWYLHISLIVENWIQILLGIVIAITLTVLILLVVLLVLKLRSVRKKVGSRNFLNESISMGQVSPTHQVRKTDTTVLLRSLGKYSAILIFYSSKLPMSLT